MRSCWGGSVAARDHEAHEALVVDLARALEIVLLKDFLDGGAVVAETSAMMRMSAPHTTHTHEGGWGWQCLRSGSLLPALPLFALWHFPPHSTFPPFFLF